MSDIGLEILVIFFLILANAVFAMSEMAVVTARKSRLLEWANNGNSKARIALELAHMPSRFLSAVQSGITTVSILAGVFAGRTIADRLATYLSTIHAIGPDSEAVALGTVVIAITYFSLVIGELVPKRLALRHPEAIATFVAIPLRGLSKIASPLVRLLSMSTDVLFHLLGKPQAQEPPVTEEEIKTLVQQGTQAGVFEESEQDMVEAVFRLGDKTARALMTPRTQVVWLNIKEPPEQTSRKLIGSGYSRFPVSDGDLDKVVGVAQAKDLLANALTGKPINLNEVLKQPTFVPRSTPALQVLEIFKRSRTHIALVVDEYGGIEGLLTHHDILEAIAGDMPDDNSAQPKAVQRQDGSWLLDGMLSVEEFKEIFHLETLPGEKRDAYQTLGGFIFTQTGRVPAAAEQFEWNGLRFEVVDMDGKRIDKVLVTSVKGASHERDQAL